MVILTLKVVNLTSKMVILTLKVVFWPLSFQGGYFDLESGQFDLQGGKRDVTQISKKGNFFFYENWKKLKKIVTQKFQKQIINSGQNFA